MMEPGRLIIQDGRCWILTRAIYNLGPQRGAIRIHWEPYEKYLLEHTFTKCPCRLKLSELVDMDFPPDRQDIIWRGPWDESSSS